MNEQQNNLIKKHKLTPKMVEVLVSRKPVGPHSDAVAAHAGTLKALYARGLATAHANGSATLSREGSEVAKVLAGDSDTENEAKAPEAEEQVSEQAEAVEGQVEPEPLVLTETGLETLHVLRWLRHSPACDAHELSMKAHRPMGATLARLDSLRSIGLAKMVWDLWNPVHAKLKGKRKDQNIDDAAIRLVDLRQNNKLEAERLARSGWEPEKSWVKLRDVEVPGGHRLELWETPEWNPHGKTTLAYRFTRSRDTVPIFVGADFKASPLHSIDGPETIISLLNFLALKPGDTDAEFFESYEFDQLHWAGSGDCDALGYELSCAEEMGMWFPAWLSQPEVMRGQFLPIDPTEDPVEFVITQDHAVPVAYYNPETHGEEQAREKGYGVRLHANGLLDGSAWTVHETAKEARQHCAENWEVDPDTGKPLTSWLDPATGINLVSCDFD